MLQTPALVDAKRGHIDCVADVDHLAYWNDPQGVSDRVFESPFAKVAEVRCTKTLLHFSDAFFSCS